MVSHGRPKRAVALVVSRCQCWLVLLLISLQGAVRVSEEYFHASFVGEASVVGRFWALIPGQRTRRIVGKALDAAGERAGPGRLSYPGGRGSDDQDSGGVLGKTRCTCWPRLGR